jgi:hypothetical protein
MAEVCLLLALATPLLTSANPNTPRLHTHMSGTSALDLPGTRAEIGATCADTRAPSTPRATARVRRAPRPPQRAFTKPNQRAASVAIPHSLFPIIATPAAAHPISLCRDSTAASNSSYSTWVFAPTFSYSTCAISPTFGEFFPRTGSGREEKFNRSQEFSARAAERRTARTRCVGPSIGVPHLPENASAGRTRPSPQPCPPAHAHFPSGADGPSRFTTSVDGAAYGSDGTMPAPLAGRRCCYERVRSGGGTCCACTYQVGIGARKAFAR